MSTPPERWSTCARCGIRWETRSSTRDLSRSAIRRGIEASLRLLGTDYLDIYYLHLPDYDVPVEEGVATLEELRVEGLIRDPATSNYRAWQMCEMFAICQRGGWAKPWIAQLMCHLAARTRLREENPTPLRGDTLPPWGGRERSIPG